MAVGGNMQELFAQDGPLAATHAAYRVREEQVSLAVAIDIAQANGQTGVFEAGTGIGKTYAYLVPILKSGKKTIISTSTKGLQEQLCNKDIPAVARALGITVDVRLLKGRANYICKHRLENAQKSSLALEMHADDKYIERDLREVVKYAQVTSDGDCAGVKSVKDFSKVWPLVTSTDSNCAKRDCPRFADCFVYQARKQAREASIVVANHALLLANAAVRRLSGDSGSLFANFEVVVFDEAHSLPENIRNFFSVRKTSRELEQTLRETRVWLKRSEPGATEHFAAVNVAIAACERFKQAFASMSAEPFVAQRALAQRDNGEAIAVLTDEVDNVVACLCGTTGEGGAATLPLIAKSLVEDIRCLRAWQEPSEGVIAWGHRQDNGRVDMWQTPLNTDVLFRECFADKMTCILLSATLSMEGSVAQFKQVMGIPDAAELIVDSPFDYGNNAMLLLPDNMPHPNQCREQFIATVAKLAVRLIRANHGAAFVLCTARSSMRTMVSHLRKVFGDEVTVLAQGESPVDELLRKFRAAITPHVLVGTRTFWQGVDVRGSALTLVVVDRIPFTPPEHPVLRAQEELYGDNAFNALHLSQAILVLKQAAGRLIRSEDDRGVLVICDPRMQSRSYGEIIIDSLPPMRLTHDIDAIVKFLTRT